MPYKTVIIHGWSDQSKSFVAVKNFLDKNGFPAESIYYGDWLSREDKINYDDVVTALNARFHDKGFIDDQNNGLQDLNLIVHSTGGLIIRHWLAKYYFQQDSAEGLQDLSRCPVKNIVMLAPANFGSPLAEMGKSWMGSIAKGTHELNLNFFSTGRVILNGLELGSEYQWNLANQDLMRDYPYFTATGIQTTVLVGMAGYEGIEGFFANKPGSDGTVVISGSNLNSVKFSLDPPEPFSADQSRSNWRYFTPPLQVAYAVLPGLNHGTITDPANMGAILLDALKTGIDPDRAEVFNGLCKRLSDLTDKAYQSDLKAKIYQQFLVHVQDDQKIGIDDFTFEFLTVRHSGFAALVEGKRSLGNDEKEASTQFQGAMTSDVNSYSQDGSYRSFLVDIGAVEAIVQKAKADLKEEVVIAFRVYVPEVDDHIYYDLDSLQIVDLEASVLNPNAVPSVVPVKQPGFLYPNTTSLVEITVRRASKNAVWVELNPTLHS